MDSSEKIRPNGMLLSGKGELLGFRGIFSGWIDVLSGDIPCVDGWILILIHNFPLSNSKPTVESEPSSPHSIAQLSRKFKFCACVVADPGVGHPGGPGDKPEDGTLYLDKV
jgi:hypothetical protein